MATPIIQSTQATPGAGTPGQGRNDLVLAEAVNLSDTEAANIGASYVWTFDDLPIGSSAVLNNATTSTPDFTPDIAGSYRLKCVVNGSDENSEVLSVPLPNTGSRIPSFDEELEYDESGNAKGWHESQDQFMRAVDTALGTIGDVAVAVTVNDTTPGNLNAKVVAGANIALAVLNPGANEQLEITSLGGTDTNAVHKNVSGEIAAITAKKPVKADVVLLEDSAAGNAKKKSTVGDLVVSPLILNTGLGGGTGGANASAVIAHGDVNSAVTASGAASVAIGSGISGVGFTSVVEAVGEGSFALGHTEANSLAISAVRANAKGTFAMGHAQFGAHIHADDLGAFAGGNAQGGGGGVGTEAVIKTGPVAEGAFAFGSISKVLAPGASVSIEAMEHGSRAGGYARAFNVGTAKIEATLHGGFAHGECEGDADNGLISVTAKGAHAFGRAKQGTILASDDGAFAAGAAAYGGLLDSSFKGTAVFGYAGGTGSSVSALAGGGLAHGFATSGGDVKSSGSGSFAMGRVSNGDIYAAGSGSHASGRAEALGLINATGIGSFAHGRADNSTIQAGGEGAVAIGAALVAGLIDAPGIGSFALGHAITDGVLGSASIVGGKSAAPIGQGAFALGYVFSNNVIPSDIKATGPGSFAMGSAILGGYILANDHGALAGGHAQGGGSTVGLGAVIKAVNEGTFVWGNVEKDAASVGSLEATQHGAWAGGYVFALGGLTARIAATAYGAFAHGYADDAVILASSKGAHAFGRADVGNIYATGPGSFAAGYSKSGGLIVADTRGAIALGQARGAGSRVYSSGDGSIAAGYALNGFDLQALQDGSCVFGASTTADIVASAINSTQFGPGTNAVSDSLQVGSGFSARADGRFGGVNVPLTLGAAATTFVAASNMMTVTGDAGANTIATITGGFGSLELTLIFVDALVTITDDNTHAANTIDLSAPFTSAQDTLLKIAFNGTSWYEVSRSAN